MYMLLMSVDCTTLDYWGNMSLKKVKLVQADQIHKEYITLCFHGDRLCTAISPRVTVSASLWGSVFHRIKLGSRFYLAYFVEYNVIMG